MKSKLSEVFFYVKQAIGIVYNSSPKWTFINALMVIFRGVLPLMLLYVVKLLVDLVGGVVAENASQPDFNQVYIAIGLVGLFFLLNAFTGSISVLVKERQSYAINDYIQRLIHQKTMNIPYGFYEDSNYQDVFYRALSDSTHRPTSIFYGILGVIQNVITLVLIMAVLTALHWFLVPFIILTATPIVLFRLFYSQKVYNLRKEQTEDERRVHYFNSLLTLKEFAKELRVFDLGSTFLSLYESKRNELRDKQWKLLFSKSLLELVVQLFSTFSLLVVFAYIILEAVKGHISSGVMVMYFLALQRGNAVLQELLTRVNSLYEDNLFLKNFFEFQKLQVIEDENKDILFPSKLSNGITLEGVSFRYPNASKWILKDVNLHIPVGKTVALVGANGSGKTTMVKLLTGLYKPQQGRILFDNTDLKYISQPEMAKNMSVIFQDFMLYNVSAHDNIWYGNVKRTPIDGDVTQAAQDAGIHTMFKELEYGYDTILGNLFKGSEQLSQGEWQRTALARSFFNQGQIIILDEPTSSLDAFTEANLINHFKEITNGKTAIIISHRLSTIKLADYVVVMQKGGVAEIGAADELLAQKGLFYQMVESLK